VQYSALPLLDHPLATLRKVRTDDIEPWCRILSQPVVYEHTSWNLSGADDLRPYLETETTPASVRRLAVVRRDNGAFIGSAGFHSVSATNRTAEMAYDLDPSAWGQGIARAACESLARWAFNHLGLMRVQATPLASNARSQHVLEACAFQREGLLRRYRQVRGAAGDFWIYARLAP